MVKRPLGTIGFGWFLSLEAAYFLPLSPLAKGVLAAGSAAAGLLLLLLARRRARSGGRPAPPKLSRRHI
ncbi:hypothetical protein [Bittarella massiliensis (ex Durand et al. 2017)]|uniref:hypothetical protein n=1 Tax=Bittarella massiliensis (ex Durand et al. 2017) TaxID=1720313 RepID=UPI00073E1B58|nr:hypothetical protein [Bittarella massiliensis (ex Durand et al. 2017)]